MRCLLKFSFRWHQTQFLGDVQLLTVTKIIIFAIVLYYAVIVVFWIYWAAYMTESLSLFWAKIQFCNCELVLQSSNNFNEVYIKWGSLYEWKSFESCSYHDRWWSKRNIEFSLFFSSFTKVLPSIRQKLTWFCSEVFSFHQKDNIS